MPRKRTSAIWAIPKDELQEVLDTSESVAEALRKLGFDSYNGNHRTLMARVEEENLSLEKLKKNLSQFREKWRERIKASLSNETVFCVGTKRNGAVLKRRMIEMGMANVCLHCGIGPEYNGLPLTLQVDHINGVNTDNRLENLRILCPNCHTQTSTFSGKRHKKIKAYETPEAKADRVSAQRKFDPSREELEAMVQKMTIVAIAKFYGVSDVAVHKRCASLGIPKKRRGDGLVA